MSGLSEGEKTLAGRTEYACENLDDGLSPASTS